MTVLATSVASARPEKDELRRLWPLVLAGFVGIMMGAWALPLYLLGALTAPLHAEFGWSVAEVASSVAFLAAGSTIAMPLIGLLADRFTARTLAVASIAIFASCLAGIAFVSGPIWHLYAMCFLLNFLGAGSGGIVYTRVIGSAFQGSRGKALGIALSGTGAAAFLLPLAAQALLPVMGWRGTVLTFAAIVAFVALPIVAFGLGHVASVPRASTTAAPALYGVTRRQALGDIRFYVVLVSVTLFGLFIAGLIVHTIPMLTDGGFSAGAAASVASLLGIAIIAGRLGVGWLLDRFPPALLGALLFLLSALGASCFVIVGPAAAPITVLTTGLLLGAEVDLLSFLTLRYFGNRHYGAIYSLLFAGYSACAMASPFFVSALVERGGYPLLYAVAAGAFITAGLMMAWLALNDRDGLSRP